jgi:hypothetical protein
MLGRVCLHHMSESPGLSTVCLRQMSESPGSSAGRGAPLLVFVALQLAGEVCAWLALCVVMRLHKRCIPVVVCVSSSPTSVIATPPCSCSCS